MTQIINPTIFAAAGAPTLLGGEVGMWIPSLDDDGNGTTTLTDLSSGGNNGTLVNMVPGSDWVVDTDNGGIRALDLDGSDDHVDVGVINNFLPNPENDWSLSMWIKTNAASNGFHALFGYAVSSSDWIQVMIERDASKKVEMYYRSIGSGAIWVSTTTAINNNAWRHVVCIKSGNSASNLSMYIDGALQSLSTHSDVAYTSSHTNAVVHLGSRQFGGSENNPLVGRIDDYRLYNKALSSGEVATLYDSGNGRGV